MRHQSNCAIDLKKNTTSNSYKIGQTSQRWNETKDGVKLILKIIMIIIITWDTNSIRDSIELTSCISGVRVPTESQKVHHYNCMWILSSFTSRSNRIFVIFSTNYTFVNRNNTYLLQSHIISNHWKILDSKELTSPVSSHGVIATIITSGNVHTFSHNVIVTNTSRTS
jgi:uncharacterized protein affecting Mg2+/Co2+ transport